MGLPATNAKQPTPAETDAVLKAERHGELQIEQVDSLIRETRGAVTQLGTSVSKARGERKRIDSAVPPEGINIQHLADNRDRALAAYNAFRTDNGLKKDATGDDRMKQILWALIIMISEGLVNSYFYAPISEYGYLGGFYIAFFVSFANVAFAFIGGAGGLRYLSHIDVLKKLVGVLVSLLCLFICLVVVALSTFFRAHVDLLQGSGLGPAEMETQAWGLAVESLQSLDVWVLMSSVNSFLLVLVGLVCAILAFHKGWEYDDPYPGFGAVFRAKERATDAYNEAHKQNADNVANWRSQQIKDLRDAENDIDNALTHLESNLRGLDRLLVLVRGLGREVSRLASGLLGVYRKKNAGVRANAAPEYFDVFPDAIEFRRFDEDLARRQEESELLKDEVAGARKDASEEQVLIDEAVTSVRRR